MPAARSSRAAPPRRWRGTRAPSPGSSCERFSTSPLPRGDFGAKPRLALYRRTKRRKAMPLSVRNTTGVLWAVSRALAVLAAAAALCPSAPAHAEGCESVVHALNQRLSPRIDEDELVSVLRSLNGSRG